MQFISENAARNQYDDWIDSTRPAVKFLSSAYKASELLRLAMPDMYEDGFDDFVIRLGQSGVRVMFNQSKSIAA